MLEIDRTLTEIARRRQTRRLNLTQRGVASDESLDDAIIEVEMAQRTVIQRGREVATLQAQLIQQQAVIEQRNTAVAQVQRDLDYTIITAPDNAFVESVSVTIGSRINVNQTIAVLLPLSSFEVVFRLSSRAYARLINDSYSLIGRSIDIEWIEQPGQILNGQITRVDPRLDEVNGGILIYASLSNLGHADVITTWLFPEHQLR